ncbi:hypothetical protein ACE6H2_020282 [Prunus campanulata]
MKIIAKYPNSIQDDEPSDLKTLNPAKILHGASLKILQEDKALAYMVVDGMVGDNTSEMAADINKDDVDKSDTDVKMESAGKATDVGMTDAGRENTVGRMNAAERMNVAAGRTPNKHNLVLYVIDGMKKLVEFVPPKAPYLVSQYFCNHEQYHDSQHLLLLHMLATLTLKSPHHGW